MFKQHKRRVRQIPDPPKPCYVVDRLGVGYEYDYGHKIPSDKPVLISLNEWGDEAFGFPSHARAHSAIHHTIEWLKSQGKDWSKADFRLVDL